MLTKIKKSAALFLCVALFIFSGIALGINNESEISVAKAEENQYTDLVFKPDLTFYLQGEAWAEVPYNYSNWDLPVNQEKADMQNENGAAPYTNSAYSAFYDNILVNGLTYADYAAKYGRPLGIRICLPGAMRLGLPNGTANVVITFKAGFRPFYWSKADNCVKVDDTYRLPADFTFVTKPFGQTWSQVSALTKVVFGVAPDSVSVTDTGTIMAYPIMNYSAPLKSGDLIYTSSDSSVIEINETTGVYNVKKSGTAVITAKYNEITVQKTYEVKSAATINKTKLSIKKGNDETLTVSKPEGLTVSSWESSDTNIATVDSNGKVTGVESGNAVITVTLNNGDTATCDVDVAAGDTVKIVVEKTTIKLNEVLSLGIDTNSDLEVDWSVNDSEGGTFENAAGLSNKFTPSKCGTITITASLRGTQISNSVEITIVSSVSFTTISVKIPVKGNYKLEYKIYPKTTTYNFTSSDAEVATVDNQGNVLGLKKGSATITITTEDNQSATVPVTVYTDVAVSIANASMTNNSTMQIIFSDSPYKHIIALTNLEKIAQSENIPEALEQYFSKIKINGVNFIDACSDFEAAYLINMHLGQNDNLLNMPAYSHDLSYNYPAGTTMVFEKGLVLPEYRNGAWCPSEYVLDNNYMYVINSLLVSTPSVTGLAFSNNEISLENGKQQKLSPVYTGNQYIASYLNPIWNSSASDIVSVTSDGQIQALKVGQATITYTLGELNASVKVTVTESRNITFEKDKVSINVGDAKKLGLNGTQEGDELVWTTSDSSIVTVDQSGNIKGVKAGKATVSLKFNGKTITCEVTVSEVKKTGCSGTLNAAAAGFTAISVLLLIGTALVVFRKKENA